jgi:hypothetical protein
MSILLFTACAAPSLAIGAVLLLPAGRVRALAAASIVVSGGAFSLYTTLSPSSQSSTVVDEATTVGKVDWVTVVEPESPQEAMPAAVLAPSIEASRTDFVAPSVKISDSLRPSIEASAAAFVAPSVEAPHFLPPSIEASETAFYEVAEEASDDRTAIETTSGPPPVVVAARVEQSVDQASFDQPAPAPKAPKQKNPKTTVKKPVSRDRANKEQRHAKAVAAPETKDQAIATNQEPATAAVQEPPSARAFPNPISKLRELFGGQ